MYMYKKAFLTIIGILLVAKVVFIIAYWISAGQMIVVMNGWLLPMWLYYVGIIVDIVLAIWAFKLVIHMSGKDWEKKKKKK